MENMIKEGAMLGSLSGSALLGFLVIVLGLIVIHLYKTLHKETQEKTKELINETKNTNILIREHISIAKASNESLLKFIETHCSKTNDRLDSVDTDLMRIDEKINKLTANIGNAELQYLYKRKADLNKQ